MSLSSSSSTTRLPPRLGGRWPAMALLLLANAVAFHETRRTNHAGDTGCDFPREWEGIWFQSTVRPYIAIAGSEMSGKGNCVERDRAGEKYILRAGTDCYKCVVFHQKAANVLQYKETFGCSPRRSGLHEMCRFIPGDANLYSMFRVDGAAVDCPFHGPLAFAYDRGKGECAWPHSQMESCTDPRRVAFHYQACPNVVGSEMRTEELECHSTWKDGSLHYLVGKLSHAHATTDEERFRCFVFEFYDPFDRSAGLKMAQSGDATCNGIFSPTEGSLTLTMTRGRSKVGCRFPRWLSSAAHWHSLDTVRAAEDHSASPPRPPGQRPRVSRVSMAVSSTNSSFIELQVFGGLGEAVPDPRQLYYGEDEGSTVLCHKREKMTTVGERVVRLILYQTKGCKSGYICVELSPKSKGVALVKLGNLSRTAEYACDNGHFDADAEPTLLTAAGRDRGDDAPVPVPTGGGLYRLASGAALPASLLSSRPLLSEQEGLLAVRAEHQQRQSSAAVGSGGAGDTCLDGTTTKVISFVLGCGADRSDMEMRSSCAEDAARFPKRYTCTHSYAEGKTTFVIFRPKPSSYSFATGAGEARLCFSLASDDAEAVLEGGPTAVAAVGDEAASEVVLTKLNQNCQPYGEDSSAESSTRPPMQRRRRQTEMKLSLAGDCALAATSESSRASWWPRCFLLSFPLLARRFAVQQ